MSNQDAGAGHAAITRAAVHEFFVHEFPPYGHGVIDGMDEEAYFRALDEAQHTADRLVDVVVPSPAPGVVAEPIILPGPTTHPAWADGAAQREHGMADPALTGAQNLAADRQFVADQTMAGHDAAALHDQAGEMAHLGAAVHALEDSYSEAHAFRADSVNTGDPNSPIESFNVFDPLPNVHGGHVTGGKITGQEQTHTDAFDNVPVDHALGNLIHGSDRAAGHAAAQLLEAEYETRHPHDTPEPPVASEADARAHVEQTLGQFYQAAPGGVGVNNAADPAFQRERDRRLREHEAEDDAWRAAHPGEHGIDLSPEPNEPPTRLRDVPM